MGKATLVFIVLLLAELGLAFGQILPNPRPENDTPQHNKALADKQYPSARVCGECHPKQYAEWSVSSHAYAALSPMFNKFDQKIYDLPPNQRLTTCEEAGGRARGRCRRESAAGKAKLGKSQYSQVESVISIQYSVDQRGHNSE